jgi:hypothetical protein
MKRDMDFVRELLLYIENATPTRSGWIEVSIPGRTEEEIAYHLQLLTEGGFIQAKHFCTTDGDFWYPTSITWSGHEFLDAARSDTIWAKAKSKLQEVGGSAALTVVKELLVRLANEALR